MDFYMSLGVAAATIFTLLCSIFYMVYGKSGDQENKIFASPPSSSLTLSLLPPSPPRSWEHDVFPSFHGPDVRKNFLSHIKKEFERKGITPFIDNNIKRGESIAPELKRAIQESMIAIVLLSKKYASSSWCLDELVEIMRKVEGQTVLTIFYEVDPTDVKKQTGEFGKVFKETCKGKTKEKTETWRKALEVVATIAGYHSKNWDDEAAMINKIADDISKELNLLAPSPYLDRLLDWPNSPMRCLRCIINTEFLVEINMPFSKLKKLWEGIKPLQNLKRINLSNSYYLKKLPNLSTAAKLQELRLDDCICLVELPFSIGNATNLQKLNLSSCSSLVKLPSSIGSLTNLQKLNLGGCSRLVKLPSSIENATNLQKLDLRSCSSLVELPCSIGNATNLQELNLRDCSSLVELNLRGTRIKEVPSSIRSWVKDCSRLVTLDVRGCRKLVSLPQLPDSLKYLDAKNCVSLERLDCSFSNPDIRLNFGKCFSLNKEARDVIIQASTSEYSVLPGGEVPACFSYRASGSSLTMELNEKTLRTSTKFKACILLDGDEPIDRLFVEYSIRSKQKDLPVCRSDKRYLQLVLRNHLYIFEFEAKEVTFSTELVFEFNLQTSYELENWKIKECGILQL